jgi:predicted O-linked N-acetylglucosamine transferase (SPINDLY family)
MSAFDARLTDEWVDPSDDPLLIGPEKPIRIEGGHLAYEPPEDAPETSAPPVAATGTFTFGSMNDALKLTDDVLATWGEILNRAPAARLLLKARQFASDDVRARVLRVLGAAGVRESRVDLLGHAATRRDHLDTYRRLDLALDTFPFPGATTTCEALYMGVPTVTLAGDTTLARLGVTILSAAGLGDFVARTRDEYVRLALDWSGNVEKLAALRASLRGILLASPLFDSARVARAIERAARDQFTLFSSRSDA